MARGRAVLEENVRLALWRMDSAISPVIAQENARPYFAYSAFYPAERAYTRMFAEIEHGEILMPSPLLTSTFGHVLIHFQFGPDGELTSPQVPTGNMRDLAEAHYTTHESIEASRQRLAELRSRVRKDVLLATLARSDARPLQPVGEQGLAGQTRTRLSAYSQAVLNTGEWQARTNNVGQTAAQQKSVANPFVPPSKVKEGVLKPVWVDESLLLARRVVVNGEEYVQGCRIDWPGTRRSLIDSIEALLPGADVRPARSGADRKRGRTLASLPVTLVPGTPSVEAEPGFTPFRVTLLIAWGSVFLAGTAVAVLLRGTMSLSERRGAFVSAVTHELRTPLTTFRMYTEMLAEGMITQRDKALRYLNTLRVEADRLGHLVENVLAYAQLERTRHQRRVEYVSLDDLIDRVADRLERRAEQASLRLVVEVGDDAAEAAVRADASAIEQILLNLVDNACKYATSASEKTVHLKYGREGASALLRVRDHGPGISAADRRRLFRPFCKSAHDAADSAPGVGLGLALSRRLARAMGGDLRLDESVNEGACFVLSLPLDQRSQESRAALASSSPSGNTV